MKQRLQVLFLSMALRGLDDCGQFFWCYLPSLDEEPYTRKCLNFKARILGFFLLYMIFMAKTCIETFKGYCKIMLTNKQNSEKNS